MPSLPRGPDSRKRADGAHTEDRCKQHSSSGRMGGQRDGAVSSRTPEPDGVDKTFCAVYQQLGWFRCLESSQSAFSSHTFLMRTVSRWLAVSLSLCGR